MLTKQRALSETRRQVDAAAVEFTSQDITRYLLLNALDTYIPLVRHIVETQDGLAAAGLPHPHPARRGAHLVHRGHRPLDLPPVQPRRSALHVRGAIALLNKMLGATVRERCITVPLEARADGMWIGQLKDKRLPRLPALRAGGRGRGRRSRRSPTACPSCRRSPRGSRSTRSFARRSPGVPLTVTHRPPPEVPVRPRQVYFMLATDDQYWRRSRPRRRWRSTCRRRSIPARPRSCSWACPSAPQAQGVRPLMERVNEVTKDCFNALVQIREPADEGPARAGAVPRRLMGFIDELFRRGQQAGHARARRRRHRLCDRGPGRRGRACASPGGSATCG